MCFLTDNGELIEMDIMVDDRLKEVIERAMDSSFLRRKRDAVRYHQRKWKDAIIPYIIDESVGKYYVNMLRFMKQISAIAACSFCPLFPCM